MLSDLRQKFNALAMRERALIGGAALVIVFLLLDAILLAPQREAERKAAQQLQNLLSEEQRLTSEMAVAMNASKNDPDRVRKQQITSLKQQMEEVEQSLTHISAGLIPADQLTAVLQQMLRESQSLALLSIQTLPTEVMTLEEENSTQNNDDAFAPSGSDVQNAVAVFRHPVELTFRGGFTAVTDYLQRLESLSWRLYWDELRYEVVDYPMAEVSLKVYTLSTERGVFSE